MNVFLMQSEVRGCPASGKKITSEKWLKTPHFFLVSEESRFFSLFSLFSKVQLSSCAAQICTWAGREVWWPLRVWCFPAESHQSWVTSGEVRSPHTLLGCAGTQWDELHGAFPWFSSLELLSLEPPPKRTINVFVWWAAQSAPELTDKIRSVCSPLSAHTAGQQRLRPRHLFVYFYTTLENINPFITDGKVACNWQISDNLQKVLEEYLFCKPILRVRIYYKICAFSG